MRDLAGLTHANLTQGFGGRDGVGDMDMRPVGSGALEITVEMLRDGFFGVRVGRCGRVDPSKPRCTLNGPQVSRFAQMKASKIVSDPTVMAGKPVVAGTRITVELILEKLGAGETEAQILDAYPHLASDAVRVALAFGARALRADVVYPHRAA